MNLSHDRTLTRNQIPIVTKTWLCPLCGTLNLPNDNQTTVRCPRCATLYQKEAK